jgi:tetratricopeptide (TPR) repeat protein
MKTCNALSVPLLASTAALAVVLASPPAHAQAQDQAAARALFEDGRRLLNEGKYQEACRTLEAASKLYASPGILLNLGDCYEKIGRTASAWTEFGEAAAVAARARRNDQVAEAKRRQAAVEPKLTKLTIQVSGLITGLTITRDDTDIASPAWGEAIPVDPGTHQIKAEATGHQPWSTSVVVTAEGQTVTVEVPTLPSAPTPPPVPVAHETEATPGESAATTPADATPVRPRSRAVAWALVGGGTAVAVAGGVLWGLGTNNASQASHADTTTEAKYKSASSDYNSAKTLYIAGIAGVGVGVAVAATGVLLMTLGHKTERRPAIGALQAAPWVSPSGGGVQVAGGW